MAEIILRKMPGGYLIGATEPDKEKVRKLKVGEGITCTYHKKRNLWFHRKYFALLNLGFETWEPEEVTHNGMPAEKNFDRFRKDIAIAAGFHDLVINIKGEVRAEAKSIAFGNMEEDEFDRLYYATVDVLMNMVLKNFTREEVDHTVNELLKFAN